MSQTFARNFFKSLTFVVVTISFYSCSSIHVSPLQAKSHVFFYEAEIPSQKTDPPPANIADQFETLAREIEMLADHFEIIEISEDDVAKAEAEAEDDCGCEEKDRNKKKNLKAAKKAPPLKKTDAKFYSKYSKKLGIPLNGTEDKQLILAINKWMGTPHRMGGCSKKGMDCSCFVKTVYRDVYGINLNRSSVSIYYNDLSPIRKRDLQEGDILSFKIRGKRISHVGIYLKDNKFVHSSRKYGVMISDMNEKYYQKRFFGAGRVADKSIQFSKASGKSAGCVADKSIKFSKASGKGAGRVADKSIKFSKASGKGAGRVTDKSIKFSKASGKGAGRVTDKSIKFSKASGKKSKAKWD
jgi:lipoprotein Spr/probable lipoprotein NlpC